MLPINIDALILQHATKASVAPPKAYTAKCKTLIETSCSFDQETLETDLSSSSLSSFMLDDASSSSITRSSSCCSCCDGDTSSTYDNQQQQPRDIVITKQRKNVHFSDQVVEYPPPTEPLTPKEIAAAFYRPNELARIDRQNLKELKLHSSSMLFGKNKNQYCIRGIEPPYRRRIRMSHMDTVLEEQKRIKKFIMKDDENNNLDEEQQQEQLAQLLSQVSLRSSRKGKRHAEVMAKYDAVSGYRAPSSFSEVVNAVFSSILIGEG